MTPELLNELYKKKNLIEVLGYTIIGLNLLKERFKAEKPDEIAGYRFRLFKYDGLDNSIDYAEQYLIEVANSTQ